MNLTLSFTYPSVYSGIHNIFFQKHCKDKHGSKVKYERVLPAEIIQEAMETLVFLEQHFGDEQDIAEKIRDYKRTKHSIG